MTEPTPDAPESAGPLIDQWCTGCGAQMHEGEPLHKVYAPGHREYVEPTPDTPESELTGDGLLSEPEHLSDESIAAIAQADEAYWRGMVGMPYTLIHIARSLALAALPNREAAPEPHYVPSTAAGRALVRALREDDGVIAPTSFVDSAIAWIAHIEREAAANREAAPDGSDVEPLPDTAREEETDGA